VLNAQVHVLDVGHSALDTAADEIAALVRGFHAKKPPLILGEEAAGIVERNEDGFKAGERVIVYGGGLGLFRDGTRAEAVSVTATSARESARRLTARRWDCRCRCNSD